MWTGLREPVGELSQSTPLRPKGVKGRDDVIRSWGELESWRRTTYLDCRHRKKQLFQDPSCKTERAKGKKCPDLTSLLSSETLQLSSFSWTASQRPREPGVAAWKGLNPRAQSKEKEQRKWMKSGKGGANLE